MGGVALVGIEDTCSYTLFGHGGAGADGRVISDRLPEGAMSNMGRSTQILRAALVIGKARVTNPHTWKTEIAQQCLVLGGVFVKFLQMLAVHATTKHIVEDMGSELAFEQVPYEPIDLSAEIGYLRDAFSSLESEPFAAGSYGQVYMGHLRSGEQVIVKVLRPSVRRTLKTDLRWIVFVATIANWFVHSSMVNVRELAKEFARATTAETNYRLEAQNGERLRAYFSERDTLVIPKTYTQLTTKHVLVQEYVGGVSLAAVSARQHEGHDIDALVQKAIGSDIWVQARTLGIELLRATIYADYLMVDPHPGNVRLLPNNKVALIDFGLVAKAPTNRQAFAMVIHEFRKMYEDDFDAGNLAVAMLAYFDADLYDALDIVAREQSEDYTVSLAHFVGRFTQSHMNDPQLQHYIANKQALLLFVDLLNENNRLGIKLSDENILLQRSMVMFMSVFRAIGQAHDGAIHVTGLRDCLMAVDEEIKQRGLGQTRRRAMSEEQAFELAANWLATIAERDRTLYRFITKRSYA